MHFTSLKSRIERHLADPERSERIAMCLDVVVLVLAALADDIRAHAAKMRSDEPAEQS
jgi:hypothetical protein